MMIDGVSGGAEMIGGDGGGGGVGVAGAGAGGASGIGGGFWGITASRTAMSSGGGGTGDGLFDSATAVSTTAAATGAAGFAIAVDDFLLGGFAAGSASFAAGGSGDFAATGSGVGEGEGKVNDGVAAGGGMTGAVRPRRVFCGALFSTGRGGIAVPGAAGFAGGGGRLVG